MSSYSIQPGGGDTAAPLIMQKRLALIYDCVDLRGLRVLDCGCGSGGYVLAFLGQGADAWGVEYDEAKVEAYRRQNPQHSRRVAQGDIERLEFADASFDAVLLNEVLEHVPDERAALREIHRVLRPGGWLLLFSPNRLYPFETHGVFLRGTDRHLPHSIPFIPYLPLRLGGRFFRYWARNYWPWELSRLVASEGFRVARTGYVWQTFENLSGRQPRLLASLRPALRAAAGAAERLPVVRAVGASQLVFARK